MANANSSASSLRPLEDAIARSADAAAGVDAERAVRTSHRAKRLASGVYSLVAPLLRPNHPYAGLDRLDRAELDETDEG
jgi:hypothetical protein